MKETVTLRLPLIFFQDVFSFLPRVSRSGGSFRLTLNDYFAAHFNES